MNLRPLLPAFVLLPLAGLLSGCAITSTVTSPAHGLALHGHVHGGQQPIAGAHVYLMAAGQSGYNNPSASLLDASLTGYSDSVGGYVLTDSGGNWDISADYTCTPNQQVYLLALGGDAGAGFNSAVGLMAVLGTCPGSGSFASSIPFVSVNEVSTVAAAYAFAGFASDSQHVSAPSTALALNGIASAFANATLLADLPSGAALAVTPNGNGQVPTAQINLLANVIASCINSTGPASTPCATLFTDATSDGTAFGTPALDTASALINIAHNPGANLADLYTLPTPSAPFQPMPGTQPNDLTLSIAYTDPSLSAPSSVAIDAQGNAWVSNPAANDITVFSSLGVPLPGSPFSNASLATPTQIAIDPLGDAWLTNTGGMTVSEFSSAGALVSGSPFSGAGIDNPGAEAIDPAGNIWITSNVDSTVTLLSGAGASLTPITGDGIVNPTAVAVDASGNAWVVNQGAGTLTVLDNTGSPLIFSPLTGLGLTLPSAVAIDSSNNAWVADASANSLTVVSPTGALLGSSTTVGLSAPAALAFDGAGVLWVANSTGTGISALNPSTGSLAGSPFIAPSLSAASSVALDGAGNVWLTSPGNNQVVELIGAAAPTVTPLSSAIAAGIGTRP